MITPSFGVTATERVLPKLALDFTTASLDPRVTFTRSLNTATRVNSSGYIEAINANLPRFDYDPITLACKGLLIEEARTNLLLYSNNFTQASWTKADASISIPAGLSPDGTQNINRITFTGAGGNQRVVQTVTTVIGQVYTSSVYLKGTVGTTVTLEFDNDALTVALTSSFVRYSKSGTASTVAAVTRIISRAGTTATVVDCYGAQTELGSFSTSYIPTTTATVTRNADVATMTGTNFSSWFNATQGSFAFKGDTLATGTVRPGIWINKSGGGNGYIQFKLPRPPGTTGITIQDDVGTVVADLSGSAITVNTAFTTCGGYKVNDFGFADRGAATVVDTAGAVPTGLDRMGIGYDFGTSYQNGHIALIRFWPQKLTTAEIQAFSKG